MNAHNEIWDKHAHSGDKGAQLAEAIMDAEKGFLNDAELTTRQDPASGGLSSSDVTIVHNGIHHHCDWTLLDSLSLDHKPILTTLHLPSQQRKRPKRLVWKWKKGNISAYTADLEERLSQNSSDENASITSAYESFCAAILTTAKPHIGLKAVGMAGESWRTTEISQAEIEKNTARAASGIQSEQYKDRDAHLKRLVRERKAEIWERKVMKGKGTKEMWSILRNLTTNKTSDIARIIPENGKNYVSPKQKTNAFVKLYRSVSSLKVEKPDRGLKKLLNGLLRSEPVHSEKCRELTLSELNAALKSLNPTKASGPDMIHPRLLHHYGPIAVNTLLRICNLSWSTMEIPQAWRVANVRPVIKAGKDAQSLDSYRPISFTSTMGKVMERLVINQLRYFPEVIIFLHPFKLGSVPAAVQKTSFSDFPNLSVMGSSTYQCSVR